MTYETYEIPNIVKKLITDRIQQMRSSDCLHITQ